MSEAIHAKEKKSRIGTATATEAVNDIKKDMMPIENMAGMNDEIKCCEFYNTYILLLILSDVMGNDQFTAISVEIQAISVRIRHHQIVQVPFGEQRLSIEQ